MYELIVRGAFLECLVKYWSKSSHLKKSQRKSICVATVSRKGAIKSQVDLAHDRITLDEWISHLVDKRPSIAKEMKVTSAAIFDKLAPIFSDSDFQRRYVKMPSFRTMVRQLVDWGIIDMPEFMKTHDALYNQLSKSVHVFPDWTDFGRRILHDRNWMNIRVIRDELRGYMDMLHLIMDIGIVIELHIMSDWIRDNPVVTLQLEEILGRMKSKGLKHGTRTLTSLLS